MQVVFVSARYTEQNALEAFFGQVFGYGQARVTVGQALHILIFKLLTAMQWTRGRFQCTLPRALTSV